MKKQYFISLAITCMVIFNVKAQNTPIDDFLKRYPTLEGVTSVTMSQQMLQSIFAPPKTKTTSIENSFFQYSNENLKVPEVYSSVTISKKDVPENLFADFKKTLLSSKYEQFMEMNRENNSLLGYYMKKVNDNTNEIVVLRHQKDQFSAIYIKGDIDINYVNHHLTMIKSALIRLGANQTGMFQFGNQFAFSMPSFDDFNFPNFKEFDFKFDTDAFNFKMDENFQLRLEESMKNAKDMMESEDFKLRMEESKLKMDESMQKMKELFESEDFQNKIKDSKNGIIE